MKKKILALCLVVVLVATAITGVTLAYFTDTTQKQTNTFTMGDIEITLDETDINKPNERTDEDQEYGVLMPGISYVKDPVITVEKNSEDCYIFLEMEMNKYVSLINLMGVDAYNNDELKEQFPDELEGNYPGFTKFVEALAADAALREAVVNRWFEGIVHEDWQVMNMDEIMANVGKVADGENAKTFNIKLGYIGDLSDKGVIPQNNDADTVLPAFMTKFTMPTTVTEEMFDGDLAYKLPNDKGEMVSKSNFNTEAAPFKIAFTAHAIQANDTSNGINSLETAYAAYFAQN